MKRFLTLITACLFVTLTLTLTGVGAQSSDTELEYRPSSENPKQGDEVTVELVLKNPDQQAVISVRSWLEYNPAHLEGLEIDAKASPFILAAPGEDSFDVENSQVKIGRSNISGGVREKEVVVAKLKFRVKTASPVTATLKPYDYQVTELGHVSVNIIDQGFPVNVLSKEPKTLELTLNGGGLGAPETPLVEQPVLPLFTLGRPMNLRINTGPGPALSRTGQGTVDLKWEGQPDRNRVGYHVYYGKTSGQYSRRRTLENVTATRIDQLPNLEVYFFAVTAYDALGRESDYSDEVGVIVGEPLSATHPFPGLLQATLGQLPQQPANGPLAWWILLSAIGLSGTLLFRNKKLQI